jgi:hypothetical protein
MADAGERDVKSRAVNVNLVVSYRAAMAVQRAIGTYVQIIYLSTLFGPQSQDHVGLG